MLDHRENEEDEVTYVVNIWNYAIYNVLRSPGLIFILVDLHQWQDILQY